MEVSFCGITVWYIIVTLWGGREVLLRFPQKENFWHTVKWRHASVYMTIHHKLHWVKIIQVKISAYVSVDIRKTIPCIISIYVNVYRYMDLYIYIYAIRYWKFLRHLYVFPLNLLQKYYSENKWDFTYVNCNTSSSF